LPLLSKVWASVTMFPADKNVHSDEALCSMLQCFFTSVTTSYNVFKRLLLENHFLCVMYSQFLHF
jgi:hypothetical protein